MFIKPLRTKLWPKSGWGVGISLRWVNEDVFIIGITTKSKLLLVVLTKKDRDKQFAKLITLHHLKEYLFICQVRNHVWCSSSSLNQCFVKQNNPVSFKICFLHEQTNEGDTVRTTNNTSLKFLMMVLNCNIASDLLFSSSCLIWAFLPQKFLCWRSRSQCVVFTSYELCLFQLWILRHGD